MKLVGTDLAHAIPLTLVAGSGHIAMGNVDFVLLGWLLIGSVPGIYLGSRLTAHIPDQYTRMAIALILMVVGAKTVL